ncbi:hypothetical protein MKZ38_002883 [Zalerion maritima]|uniref:Uncharacterized protein n=1 Tax=Zalerion maritima TaxID=339359 RepID=A0AAD5S506_9PEZI|nr:hypothetical protein MKZ38_002883 [Zalerion maritima]
MIAPLLVLLLTGAVSKASHAGVWLADLSSSLDPNLWPEDLDDTINWGFQAVSGDEEPGDGKQIIGFAGPAEVVYNNAASHDLTYCGLLKTNESAVSVIVVSNSTTLKINYCTIQKAGAPLNVWEAYEWGYNSAVKVGHGSQARLTSVNITTHGRGAPGFTVDGRGFDLGEVELKFEEDKDIDETTNNDETTADKRVKRHQKEKKRGVATTQEAPDGFQTSIMYSTFYSTGAWAPNVLALPKGLVYAMRNTFFTSGHRSPNFEARQDVNIFCEGCLLHTQGKGSALTYGANATVSLRYSAGAADTSPVAILDGNTTLSLDTTHLTSHNSKLGGIIAFNSAFNTLYQTISLVDSWLVVTDENAPGIWVGNTKAEIKLDKSHVEAKSGVILLANNKSLAWGLGEEGVYGQEGAIKPAIVLATLSNIEMGGDIVAEDGAKVLWTAEKWVDWAGAARPKNGGEISVSLREGCRWALTGHSIVKELYGGDEEREQQLPMSTFSGDLPELENVYGNGWDLYYLETAEKTAWLKGREYALRNGGMLRPYTADRAPEIGRLGNGTGEDCGIGGMDSWVWPSLETKANGGGAIG